MSNKLKIDWDKVDKMLEAGCSGEECASALGIHSNTLYNRCKEDRGEEFVTYRAQKRASGEVKLRLKQQELALEGDKTMLVWLGKQRLDQREKLDTRNTHKGEPITVNIVRTSKPTDETEPE